jgi:hypothetical protein
MLVAIDVSKEIEEEEAGRVIARRAKRGVTISYEGSDKGEIDQGGNHFRVSALHRAIGEDFNELFFEVIMGK